MIQKLSLRAIVDNSRVIRAFLAIVVVVGVFAVPGWGQPPSTSPSTEIAAPPKYDAAYERAAAQFMLDAGAEVAITSDGKEQKLKSGAELPEGDFVVVSIAFRKPAWSTGKNDPIVTADLAKIAKLSGIKMLILNWINFGDEGAEHLRALTSLEALLISGCGIGDVGLAHLSGLGNLNRLILSYNSSKYMGGITNAGLKHLKHLTKLEELSLGDCAIDDNGISNLSGLTNVKSLGLFGTGMTDEGLENLHTMTNLERFFRERTKVSEAGEEAMWAAIRARKPKTPTPTVATKPQPDPKPLPKPVEPTKDTPKTTEPTTVASNSTDPKKMVIPKMTTEPSTPTAPVAKKTFPHPPPGPVEAINGSLRTLGDEGPYTCISYSRDGEQIAAGNNLGFVTIWETSTGNQTFHEQVARGSVVSLAVSEDASRMITCAQRTTVEMPRVVSIWDVNQKVEIRRLFSDEYAIPFAVHISPSGNVAASALRSVTSSRHKSLGTPQDRIRVGIDGGLVWDVETTEELMSGVAGATMYFFDDDTVISFNRHASRDDGDQLWSIAQKRILKKYYIRGNWLSRDHHEGVTLSTISPNGTAALTHNWYERSTDSTGNRFDPNSYRQKLTSWFFDPLTMNEDTGRRSDHRLLFEVVLARPLTTGRERAYKAAAISDDGRYAILARLSDSVIEIWDLRYGRLLHLLNQDGPKVERLILSPAGDRFATANDQQVVIWGRK